jgi:tagatose 6-phosphate kinase
MGFLGGDRGRQILAWLGARQLETDFVMVPAPTRLCVTVVDQEEGSVTELVEESRAVEPSDFEKLQATLDRRISASRAVIMSGTIAPGGPVNLYEMTVRRAQAAGILSVVDAQGPPLSAALNGRPGLVKPNRTELEATVRRQLPDEPAVLGAMRELAERGAQRVVITAGKQPTLAYDGKDCWRIRPPGVRAVNPIGSGDAFTAALVWRLLRGEHLGEACRWACAVGAANALTWMAGEIDPSAVGGLADQVVAERLSGNTS